MTEPEWLEEHEVLAIHEGVLSLHGGAEGVRDEGLLQSALARPRQLFAYGDPPPDLCALAAAYAAGIIKNHPFVDGNKRTGFLLAYTFLRLNGLELRASEGETYMMIMALAAGDLPEAAFAQWLREWT